MTFLSIALPMKPTNNTFPQSLQTLAHHHLFANLQKCDFGRCEISYLGHIISAIGGSRPRQNRSHDLMAPPQNLKELRGFLGLTGYYRKFVAGYAKIANHLMQLLNKDNFNWTQEATLA